MCSVELNVRRFRAHYRVGTRAIAALIKDLRKYQPEKKIEMALLFMSLYWLKSYVVEEVMAGAWGYGEKYCREASRDYQLRIAALKPIKINFKGLDPRCKFAPVDGVHVRTEEFRCDPSSKWFSHKFNGPGVGFEVVCNPTNKGGILWATRGLPAAVGDLTKFRGGKRASPRNTGRKTLFITIFRLE